MHVLKREPDKARRAFGLTLFYTGCRISEALNLTTAGVDLSQRCLVFETLKRRKPGVFRAIPIPDELVKLLVPLLATAAPSGRIWALSRATAFRCIKAQMIQAGITGAMASPKGLRHGFAVAAVAQSIPLPTVQKWLGHARLETTAIYLGVTDDEERNLARRLWGRSGR